MMSSRSYVTMAEVYDAWMEADRPPYESWVAYIANESRLFGSARGDLRPLVLDVGCGTGNMASLFASQGWGVYGVDPSPDMISIASKKRLVGCEFSCDQLPDLGSVADRTFDLAIACFDTINYLRSVDDLRAGFAAVAKKLRPGGVFVFDVNSAFKLREMWANHHWGDDFDRFAYVWRNSYVESSRHCDIEISFFVKMADGKYERRTEQHRQMWFSDAEVLDALGHAGLELRRVASAYSFQQPGPETLRVSWTAGLPVGPA